MTSRKNQKKIQRDKKDVRKFFTTAIIVTIVVILVLYLVFRASI